MSCTQNLVMDQGTNKTFEFFVYTTIVYNTDGTVNELSSTKMNVTGGTAKMTVTDKDAAGRTVKTFDSDLLVGDTNGKISLILTPSDTNSIAFNTPKFIGYYEIELTLPSGTFRPFEGMFTLTKRNIK